MIEMSRSESVKIPEHVRRVDAGEDPELERLVAVLGAPHVGRADPEHLPLAVLAQPGQQLLVVVARHPLVCKGQILPVRKDSLCNFVFGE